MSSLDETFFTAVGCMDGRVQDVIAEFGRERFQAKYPDTITEAGLVGKLSKDGVWEDLKLKIVNVSLGKHHSRGIVVHGHQECAGNPVDDDKHKDDIRESVKLVKEMAGETPVIGVFVGRNPLNPSVWEAMEV